MNKYIKDNFNKLLTIFLLLQPIIDLITGISVHYFDYNVTFGIVFRVLFLLYIVYATTFVYKKRLSISWYLVIIIYSLLYILGLIMYKDLLLFKDLQGLVKAMYFPTLLISLYDLREEFSLKTKTLFKMFIIYLILILLPNCLGLGFESYEIAKGGNLGFFNSANEISGIISILTPIMFVSLKESKSLLLKIVYIIIYLAVILTIGTKTPLLTLFITIGWASLFYIIKNIQQKKYKPIAVISVIIVIAFGSLMMILPKTTFYKNIKIHLDFLEVDNILDIFKDKELVDHFVFSQRLTFFEKRLNDYHKTSLYERLFGMGYTKNDKTVKLIEMDFCDLFFSQGIIGLTIVLLIYAYVLYKLLKQKRKLNFERYMVLLSSLLIILLSSLTGHIITAPTVSLIAIVLILKLYKKTKVNELVGEKMNNKKEPLISIVIPVYNVEKYLKECIESLINQTYKNIELIFINDGSTDHSLQILNEYKKNNPKIMKVINNKNNGIGKTRNIGIDESKGKYLFFVDSDDYIANDAIEKLYHLAKNQNADIVIGDMYKVYENKDRFNEFIINFSEGKLLDNKTQLFEIPLGPCGKLFKKEILTVKFSDKLKYEDVPFTANAIKNSSNTIKCNDYIYYYRIHHNSETTSMDARVFDILEILKLTNQNYEKNPEVKEELEYLNIQLLSRYNLQQKYQKDKKLAEEFLEESFAFLNKNFPYWKKNKYLKKRNILKRIIETHKFLIKCYWKV